jgi:hypothetical protein
MPYNAAADSTDQMLSKQEEILVKIDGNAGVAGDEYRRILTWCLGWFNSGRQ